MDGVLLTPLEAGPADADLAALVTRLLAEVDQLRAEVAGLRRENLELRQQAGYWQSRHADALRRLAAFVLEQRKLPWPADLYLEGSDQHRGWFHSSLLESVGTRGVAPFKAILTHGFVNDEHGRKMSKSLGNVVAPDEIADKFGVDILRLWVMMSDTTEDLRIGPEILKQQAELYRRIRNTMRWLLGCLDGYTDAEAVTYGDMPELERYMPMEPGRPPGMA